MKAAFEKLAMGILLTVLVTLASGTVQGAVSGDQVRNDYGQIRIMADPAVNKYYVPAPGGEALRATPAATVTINFLPAGSGLTLWGDTAVAWPAAASNALLYAASIWAGLLSSPEPLTINAAWVNNLGAGVLGHSGSVNYQRDFTGAAVAGTWYPATLANAQYGGDLNPSDPDIYMGFSSTFSWYYGTDGNTPVTEYDLVSVVLHEICHGLGFAGSMTVSSGQGSWGSGTAYPIAYDRFTEDNAGISLLNTGTYPNPSVALANALISGSLYFDGTHANAANGGVRVPIYSPGTWSQGSSYSHLAEVYNGTPNALMTYSLGYGEAIHSPGTVTMGLLQDIGWQAGAVITQTYTLTVQSVNPATGVAITVSPADNNSQANGATSFTREYDENTIVTLTAPLTAGGNVFRRWELNSVSQGTNRVLQATMSGNKTAAAIYSPLNIPTGVSASDGVYNNKIRIAWSASVGATKYRVYRSQINNSATAVLVSGDVAVLQYDDTTVTYGEPYFYWVKAGAGSVWTGYSGGDSGYAFSGGGGTVTLLDETFEGTFPGSSWSIYGTPTWGVTSYRSAAGGKSAYCCGSSVAAPGPYVSDMRAWMIHGPFDLADAVNGSVSFDFWLNSEASYDYVFFGLSTNGMNFYGYGDDGDYSASGWLSFTMYLTNAASFGNLCGEPQVWFACYFYSDSSYEFEGAYIDNVLIQKTVAGGGTAMPYVFPTNIAVFAAGGASRTTDVQVSNLGSINLIYSVPHPGDAWLGIAPTNGVVLPGATGNIRFICDSSGVAPGVHHTAAAMYHNAPSSPKTIPVEFVVPEPGTTMLLLICIAAVARKRNRHIIL